MTAHDTHRSDDLPRQPSGNWSPDAGNIDAILTRANVRGLDLLPSGSNYVFVMALEDDAAGAGIAIYKPERGEAPLHDFPDGTLYRRERAAYLVSEALGWRLVPPTVVRDGPHGVGTAQLFIEHQARGSYFSMKSTRVAELRRMATFDAFVNNADRKGGHCLDGRDGRVWGIDHGLTFHRQDKLRTVIWDWAGEPIDAPHLDDVARVVQELRRGGELADRLGDLLHTKELRALCERGERLLTQRTYPLPPPWRSVPWPPM